MMDRVFSAFRNHDSAKACRECGQPATKDALFDVGNGIAVVERYCDRCVEIVNRSSA